MTNEDIAVTIGEFVSAAKRAFDAGFDFIQLHAANGVNICHDNLG
jgi:2,4-dienoyl-CoA reductase-like NADH-dependent reductase (Old Yellow Enzyme family)